MTTATPRLRRLPTAALTAAERAAIRALMDEAFHDDHDPDEAFNDDDWQHALGGTHVVLDVDGEILAHASVVERRLQIGELGLRTGYVEAVATSPARQGEGFGKLRDAGEIIRAGRAGAGWAPSAAAARLARGRDRRSSACNGDRATRTTKAS
jgi:aminoglycoside 2'-N-acetyltransferase I